ncbi:MAG: NAD-dependent deacylase [Balneolaceae bacterium]
MKHVVVLSGAGMSADSGLATFRDSGGLWEGYDIHEVASIEGWRRDPEHVLDFYNKRRRQAFEAEPNAGHRTLAELEKNFKVTIITQNVDDLHERAGSSNVLHLHGELRKARSEKNRNLVYDIGADPIKLGDTADDGAQLRPHIVWFGERVPMIEKSAEIVQEADIMIVIGTSLVVYPAAGLVDYGPNGIPKYIVDPSTPELNSFSEWEHIKATAAKGTPVLKDKILNQLK